jgi:hypothetical protein
MFIVISLLLVIALFSGVWLGKNHLPEGLFAGTFWISASAVCFLLGVSLWNRTFTSAPVNHDGFTVFLALIAIGVGSLIWFSSTMVGDWLGSLNVCLFAFGAALAILNGVGWISKFFIDRRVAVNRVKFAALSLVFLLLLAALTSLLRDFHQVRLCATEVCEKVLNQPFASIQLTAIDDLLVAKAASTHPTGRLPISRRVHQQIG